MDVVAPLQNEALSIAALGVLVSKLNRLLNRDIMDADAMLQNAAQGALGRERGATNINGTPPRNGAQCDQAALGALGREWGPTAVDLMVWGAAGRDQAARSALGREWGATAVDLMVWGAAATNFDEAL